MMGAGVVLTGVLAYAVYFDYRRRTDPEFRKMLKRESKKQARAAKEEAEAQGAQQKKAIREAVDKANEDGFPRDPEEVEAYFMQEVARGEGLCQEGMSCQFLNTVLPVQCMKRGTNTAAAQVRTQ